MSDVIRLRTGGKLALPARTDGSEPRRIYFSCVMPSPNCVPLVWGLLRAHCETNPVVASGYRWETPFYGRERVAAIRERVKEPFLVGLSCYTWNFHKQMRIAETLKQDHPGVLIVAGGPHVPERAAGFFAEHPYVDVLVHEEGELPFERLLVELAEPEPDLDRVPGISYNRARQTVHTGPGQRLPKDLSTPSPYLLGYFDDIIREIQARGDEVWAFWETNRGCPYGCTFCDWGSATLQKLRQFPTERLHAEIAYFSRMHVDLVHCCDANFGILERDEALAAAIIDAKKQTGWPKAFRGSEAKKSNDRVFNISRALHYADMNHGTTLAMQSLSPTVLRAIDRETIGIENYEKLKLRYAAEGIPTVVELILGLPGETKESWIDGLCTLLRSGHHDDIKYWELDLLPNSPMTLNGDREKYQLKTIKKAWFPRRPDDDAVEAGEIVVGTSTLSTEEWFECEIFAEVMILALHNGAYTRFLSQYLARERGIDYKDFYLGLYRWGQAHPMSLVGLVLARLRGLLAVYVAREDIAQYSRIYYQPDLLQFVQKYSGKKRGFQMWHWVWLLLNENLERFYREITEYLGPTVDEIVSDLIAFQRDCMLTPAYDPKTGKTRSYRFDWPHYFAPGGDHELVRASTTLRFTDTGMGLGRQDLLEKGNRATFAMAALGDLYPSGKYWRFFHQLDRMEVTRAPTSVAM